MIGPQTAHRRWERKLDAGVDPGPVIGADGTVYAASDAGRLYAIDPVTGQDRWVFDGGGGYGSDLSTSPAVLADGTVLWPGPHDTLFAVSSAGRLLWQEGFAGRVLSPALAANGRVYLADQAGTVAALDTGSGAAHRIAWRLALGDQSFSSPALAPDGTLVVATQRTLFGLNDLGTRVKIQWRWQAPAVIEVSPGVAPDGTTVVGLNDPFSYGIGPDGRLRWRWEKGDWSYSSAVITPDGRAFFGDHKGFLDIVDARTGTVIRRSPTNPGPGKHPQGIGVWTSPAVDSAGNAYFGTAANHIYGVAADGHQLFDITTGGTVDSYPALGADGTLYIGSADGILHAIG